MAVKAAGVSVATDRVNSADAPTQPTAPSPSIENKPTVPRYIFETVSDLRSMPPQTWLVDRWIPDRSVGIIYGRFASGKSFIAFDLLLHLVYGMVDWHGIKLPGAPCCGLLARCDIVFARDQDVDRGRSKTSTAAFRLTDTDNHCITNRPATHTWLQSAARLSEHSVQRNTHSSRCVPVISMRSSHPGI